MPSLYRGVAPPLQVSGRTSTTNRSPWSIRNTSTVRFDREEIPISDKEILEYATPYVAAEFSFRRVILGRHGNAVVVADYPCSDVCPDNTVRIIRYWLNDLDQCERIGGIVRGATVPYGIGRDVVRFCFPRVLIENWDSIIR